MRNQEKKLSEYIDRLNEEKMPKEHKSGANSQEYEELLKTVRMVRTLREPAQPSEDYHERLEDALGPTGSGEDRASCRLAKSTDKSQGKNIPNRDKATHRLVKRTLIAGMATVAAGVLLFTSLNVLLPFNHPGIVSAMVRALGEVKAYHGILEVVETNGLGERMTQLKREVWADKEGNYYVKEDGGFSDGQVTVNNGHMKWQLRPGEEKAYIFEAFPDPYRFSFELGKEVEEVKKALTVKKIGEEKIAGRMADIMEVTPDGGAAYKLWIDQETDLPLQKQSATQNALQTTVTYTQIDFEDAIPEEFLSYSLPDGYEEINKNEEQFVNSIEEAGDIAGFLPAIPENIPQGYELAGISANMDFCAVRFYYNTPDKSSTVMVEQLPEGKELDPDTNAILGSVGGNEAEMILSGEASIRWQSKGYEYKVLGNTSLEELALFAQGLNQGEVLIPAEETEPVKKPQIEIPVDLETEESDQKSVDAGHSPWKLDPAFVTQVFASLLLSPQGITGDYPIAYDDISIIENNGIEAVAQINGDATPARYVYLKRLVRGDDTGIWTVVGYDPVAKNQQQ